jgi:hypothetical protein
MPQGAWTDLYALGATLHFVITGRAPTPSVLRAVRDVLPALSSSAGTSFPEIPPRLLAAIDWTLALAPDERPQSVLDLRRALAGELAPPAPSLRHTVVVREAAPEPEEDDEDDDEASAPAGEAPVPAALTRSARESELTQARATPGRGARLGLTASLALLGIAALAWGAWTLNHQSPAVVHEAPLAVDATKATARFAQQLDPAPADAPTPSPDAVAPALGSADSGVVHPAADSSARPRGHPAGQAADHRDERHGRTRPAGRVRRARRLRARDVHVAGVQRPARAGNAAVRGTSAYRGGTAAPDGARIAWSRCLAGGPRQSGHRLPTGRATRPSRVQSTRRTERWTTAPEWPCRSTS